MEILALGIVVLVVVWVFGFMKSIRSVADMANNEIGVQAAVHKGKCVDRLAALDVEGFADKHAKAKSVAKAMKEFNL